MRVLMTGATGFIGNALAQALLREGHELVCAVREPARLDLGPGRWRAVRADLSTVPDAAWWQPHLAGVQAVINAVGIIREQPGQAFDALHARAPSELFQAAADAGVRTAIQISALGADDEAQSRYHRTKKIADDTLRALPLAGAVVQPSIVYGAQSPGAAMFNSMAAAPLLAMPQAGAMQVQPVHVDDVVAGVLALLAAPPTPVATVAFVGPEPLAMADYLRQLRGALGLPGGLPVLPLPTPLFLAGAHLAAHVPGSMLDPETAGMLLRGNAAPSQDFRRLLGRAPRAVPAFIEPHQVAPLRARAVLDVWQPVLRVALALAWFGTALALFQATGPGAAIATLLGLSALACPARWRRALWLAQGALVAVALLVAGAVLLPRPSLTAWGLPGLALLGLLWALEPATPPKKAVPAA